MVSAVAPPPAVKDDNQKLSSGNEAQKAPVVKAEVPKPVSSNTVQNSAVNGDVSKVPAGKDVAVKPSVVSGGKVESATAPVPRTPDYVRVTTPLNCPS